MFGISGWEVIRGKAVQSVQILNQVMSGLTFSSESVSCRCLYCSVCKVVVPVR